jgi:EF-hand domain pair
MLSYLAASSVLTRTRLFRKLAKGAFDTCDTDGTGHVNKDELYAGILLVHVELAKYVGVAACFPPSRQVCDQLFQASDDDGSGYIDENEFTQIAIICCAQILSRIFVYFSLMILLVPLAAHRFVKGAELAANLVQWHAEAETFALVLWLERVLTLNGITEKSIALLLSFLVIPALFDLIDSCSKRSAEATHVVDLPHQVDSRIEKKQEAKVSKDE